MIYYLPFENIDERYTKHFNRDVINYLQNNHFQNYRIVNGLTDEIKIVNGSFLDSSLTVQHKSIQISELAKIYQKGMITDNDIIFVPDVWYTGILSIPYMNYFHKVKPKLVGVLHAGSFTDTDHIRKMERWAKNYEEAIFDVFDTIFVASEFIKEDVLQKRLIDKRKVQVSGLIIDELQLSIYDCNNKKDLVVFNGRNDAEKQPWLFDKLADIFPSTKFVKTYENSLSKHEYYELLSQSKVVVSYALQENFGYGIVEATKLGCIPVLPNRLVYPELYDEKYLYNTFDESVNLIEKALSGKLETTKPKIPTNNETLKTWFPNV
jgi:glycosyltransferase involved in cell wall biosynthesis